MMVVAGVRFCILFLGTGAGWSITARDEALVEQHLHLGRTATVFQAEVSVINEVMQWLLEDQLRRSKLLQGCHTIEIHSDSQAAILCLANETVKGKTAIQCAKRLALLASTAEVPIKLRWIRGHNNSTSNELADMLAKKGAPPFKVQSHSSPYHQICSRDAYMKV